MLENPELVAVLCSTRRLLDKMDAADDARFIEDRQQVREALILFGPELARAGKAQAEVDRLGSITILEAVAATDKMAQDLLKRVDRALEADGWPEEAP